MEVIKTNSELGSLPLMHLSFASPSGGWGAGGGGEGGGSRAGYLILLWAKSGGFFLIQGKNLRTLEIFKRREKTEDYLLYLKEIKLYLVEIHFSHSPRLITTKFTSSDTHGGVSRGDTR